MKSRVPEYIVYMFVYINDFEAAASSNQSFLGFQQDPKTCAGNILKRREIERLGVGDTVHKCLRFFALRSVKATAANYFAIISKIDLKHL